MCFSDGCDDGDERAGAFSQGFEVVFFVVKFVVLPAAKEDALPLVGEAS